MEMKLIDLEEENELTLCGLQLASDSALQQLRLRQAKLEEEYEQAQIRIHNQEADLRHLEQEAKNKREEAETLRTRVASYESRVALL
jgi:predicted  nucleic acid-binding Zn-ribbon protein